METILVFLNGDLVYDGQKEGFIHLIQSLSGADVTVLVDRTLQYGHVIDSTLGDFELVTQEVFNREGYTLEDFAIRSYERQLEDCEEEWRPIIEREIELLRSGAVKKEW